MLVLDATFGVWCSEGDRMVKRAQSGAIQGTDYSLQNGPNVNLFFKQIGTNYNLFVKLLGSEDSSPEKNI